VLVLGLGLAIVIVVDTRQQLGQSRSRYSSTTCMRYEYATEHDDDCEHDDEHEGEHEGGVAES
jgi:hypothetical protein